MVNSQLHFCTNLLQLSLQALSLGLQLSTNDIPWHHLRLIPCALLTLLCQVEETRSLLGKVPTACSREATYSSARDRLVSRAFDLANVTNSPSSTADIGPTCSEVANLSLSYPLWTTRRCRFGKGDFLGSAKILHRVRLPGGRGRPEHGPSQNRDFAGVPARRRGCSDL